MVIASSIQRSESRVQSGDGQFKVANRQFKVANRQFIKKNEIAWPLMGTVDADLSTHQKIK